MTLPPRATSDCALNCARQPPGDVLKVRRAHDVVAVEHGARLVPRHGHRHPLWHPSIDHVAHGGAPEVMAEHPRMASRATSRLPSPPEVLDALAAVATLQMRKEARDDPPGCAL